MNSDLKKMYQKIVMKNYKNPMNLGITKGLIKSEFKNPSCGDEAYVGFKVENNIITVIKQEVVGCSICKASASVLTKELVNKTTDEALYLIDTFKKLVSGEENLDIDALGEAAFFVGVKEFPARRNCAVLSWKALELGLNNYLNDENI